MTDFCPDGYVPASEAIAIALAHWFPEQIAAATPEPQTKPKNDLEAAVRAFSQPHGPDASWHAIEEITRETVHRLRNLLHQGTLKACYFANDGRHSVLPEFWATAEADGAMESGIYWPFGKPNRLYEQRLSYSIFLEKSELDALLSDQQAKRPLPLARKSELVGTLQELDHLSRREQLKELRARFPAFNATLYR